MSRIIRRSIVVTGKAEHDRVWEYPVEALRETVTNAICHRDYASPHDIQIKILEDRLVVISPGLLPFEMDLETLENPEHGSRPRNKLIAQAFYDMHLIEHYGSGIRRIKDECTKNGNKPPEWSQNYGSFITVYKSRLGLEGVKGTDEVVGEADNKPDVKRTTNGSLDPVNEVVNSTNGTINDTIKQGCDTTNDTTNASNDTINDTIKQKLLDTINHCQGMKRSALAEAIHRSIPTIARLLAELEQEGKIEYRGSKKTGGYYAVKRGD